MFLEILIRQGEGPTWKHYDRGMDNHGVRVPISHVWQEEPDDLHIHFGMKDDAGYQPVYDQNASDYIVPDPSGAGFARAYSLTFVTKPCAPIPVASLDYIRRLKQTWVSPNNSDTWPLRKQVREFIRRMNIGNPLFKLSAEEFVKKYPDAEINENCCTDLACSKCGARHGFSIEFTGRCLVFDDGTDDDDANGDKDWDDKSECECRCGAVGCVDDFTIKGLDEKLEEIQDAIAGERKEQQ